MYASKLSISRYQENEEGAVSKFGNDILWAFTPVTFMTNGYASRVRTDDELIRYVDPMKEALSRHVDDSDKFLRQYSLRTRFTDQEKTLMLSLREAAARLTEELFGRRITPLNSILSAMGLYRTISHIQKAVGGRQLRILEVGPGAGYLGALLIQAGHEYAAVDATQAFYMWQNRFFSHVTAEGFEEQAVVPAASKPQFGKVTHIPWWHFVHPNGAFPFKADIVICEQAISEMHAWASRYMAMALKTVLAESDLKLLIYSDYGHPTVSSGEIDAMLGQCEYSRVLSKLVYAYTPGRHQLPPAVYSLDTELPLIGLQEGGPLHAPSSFLKVKRSELPLDLEFRRLLNIWPHYDLFVIDG